VRTDPHLACAACDHFQTAHHAASTALLRGYSRPGLVLEAALDDLTDHRFAGGFLAAVDASPAGTRASIFRGSEHGAREFTEWFRSQRPDIVLTLHEAVREWLSALGGAAARTPVVHLDWHEGLAGCSGMKQDNLTVGSRVVDLVVSQIHSNERGASRTPVLTLAESTWVESLPPSSSQVPASRASGSTLKAPKAPRTRASGKGASTKLGAVGSSNQTHPKLGVKREELRTQKSERGLLSASQSLRAGIPTP
jgi:LacI family transcriptional regulator